MVNYTKNNTPLNTKINDLDKFISNYKSAIVAYSGGIDSSLLASILSAQNKDTLNTYSIDFLEEGYSEGKNARNISKIMRNLRIDNHEHYTHL